MSAAIKLVLALMVASPAIASSAPAASAINTGNAETEVILRPIFDGLTVGSVRTPLIAAFDRSPLWRPKTAEKDQMVSQIELALRLYGPVRSYELIKTEKLGSYVEHDVVLVQHRDNVTRWQVWLTKTTDGWGIGYFGFEDQVQNWFKDQ